MYSMYIHTYIYFIFEGLIQQAVTVDLSSRRRRQQNENSSFIEEVGTVYTLLCIVHGTYIQYTLYVKYVCTYLYIYTAIRTCTYVHAAIYCSLIIHLNLRSMPSYLVWSLHFRVAMVL